MVLMFVGFLYSNVSAMRWFFDGAIQFGLNERTILIVF